MHLSSGLGSLTVMISSAFGGKIIRFSLAVTIFGSCLILPCLCQGKCEPVTTLFCQGVRYNTTIYPNISGQRTQEQAAIEVSQYYPLVKTGCSKHLKLFLCYVYVPVCTVLETPVPPCRSTCNSARDGCQTLMKEHGMSWPASLSCDKFPVQSERICVGDDIQPTPNSGKFSLCNASLNSSNAPPPPTPPGI